MAFYRLFEFFAVFYYIDIVLLILFTGIKPLLVLTYLRKICDYVANSFVFIHPIRVRRNLSFAEAHPRIVHSSVIREYEHAVEFIYATVESYRVKEQWHIVADHLGRWHIGLVLEVVDEYNEVVLCVDVLLIAAAFFTFPMQTAKKYVIDIAEDDDSAVILASDLAHNIRQPGSGLYDLPDLPLVVKTYWIRIIQRRWKSVYAERRRILKLRGGLKAQRQFELCGNYGLRKLPGLRGLLFVESKQI
jgi:hypothetical protein